MANSRIIIIIVVVVESPSNLIVTCWCKQIKIFLKRITNAGTVTSFEKPKDSRVVVQSITVDPSADDYIYFLKPFLSNCFFCGPRIRTAFAWSVVVAGFTLPLYA
jgi:hypothetical protein